MDIRVESRKKQVVKDLGSVTLPFTQWHSDLTMSGATSKTSVSLLTGGGDRPYAFGLATELIAKGAALDVVGSDELDGPEFRDKPGVRFLNLRGDRRPDVGFAQKSYRVLAYYARLILYAATAEPKIFHILWNNKFLNFDRTLLMLYYRLLGKTTVLTVHNVNAGTRDSNDTIINRLTLRIQYLLSNHIFVHTEQMKRELFDQFNIPGERVTVIPFGINNAVPNTNLTSSEARQRLGIRETDKTLLFFGHITPYKGLEYLVSAFQQLHPKHDSYKLIIAGRPKDSEEYWSAIRESMSEDVRSGRILLKEEFIPDEETEIYFKAADALALPYRHIYQSGVLFLGYSFGLPVLAADVGALKEEILEGETGFVFKAEDPVDLAATIEKYFASDLFANLAARRQGIRNFALEKHSWNLVGQITMSVYSNLFRPASPKELSNPQASEGSSVIKDRS